MTELREKRDLSDNLMKRDKEAKRQHEGSLEVSQLETSTSFGLEKRLKSEDCLKIPLSCMKNFEKQVKEIHSLAPTTNASLIKGKK